MDRTRRPPGLRTTRTDNDEDWSGLVVFFGGTAWDGNRFPDQHIAERLSRWTPVLYVDPPLSIVRARLRDGRGLFRPRPERLSPGLLRLTPMAPPGPIRAPMRPLTYALMRRAARQVVRDLGASPRAVVVASLNPLLDAVPAPLAVLYGTDDFVAGARLMDVGGRWLEQRETKQLARADLVVAVSEDLAEAWRRRGTTVDVVPNGCDAELFATSRATAAPPDVRLPRPIAGFVGHMSERIDLTLLEAVADTGTSLLLVGPRQATFGRDRMDGLLARSNVQWVGAKPFEALPSYVGVMDVGLVPYTDSDFNRASFPLKTLEYLAVGLPVVSTDLPAVRYLGSPDVEVAASPTEFAGAVVRAVAQPYDAGVAGRRAALAQEHSWDRRAEEFARLLGITPIATGSP